MIKLPFFVLSSIVAFNITLFALFLQMDWLMFHSGLGKVITWAAAVGAWHIAYTFRNR